MSKERDWPADLGMLDWDNTSIVFTKRTLVEFLKYTGTTVDTNFSNIGKLPRYARFGKLSPPAVDSEEITNDDIGLSSTATDNFVASQRVRTAPGGPHTDIFAHDEGDALSKAPPKVGVAKVIPPASAAASVASQPDEEEEQGINFSSAPMPTRRVRENPGGNSSMANFWDPADANEFKPTRRVRQGPGGHDSINEIF